MQVKFLGNEQSELEARVLDFEREILRLKVALGNASNIIGGAHSRSDWRAGTSSDNGLLIRTQLEQLLHESEADDRVLSIEEEYVALVSRVEYFEIRLSRLRALESSLAAPVVKEDANCTKFAENVSSDCKPGIELDNPVTSTEIFKEGLLKKKGGGDGGRRNWTLRWFTLGTDTLMYFKNKQDTKPKGVITLVGAIVEAHQQRPFGIIIRTPTRDYLVCTSNYKEQMEWMEILRTRITALNTLY